MVRFDKIPKALAAAFALGVAAFISGCGEQTPPPADLEVDHCARAAQRITRDVGPIKVIESQAWTLEETRNVRVRFAYPETEDGPSFGNIMCSYAFPLKTRGDKSRQPVAQSIYYRARYLSENELLLLNLGLRGVRR